MSRDRAHMAAIGREGGESRGARNRRRQGGTSRGLEGTAAGVGASGAAYSDRESPVELSREGMVGQDSGMPRSSRDDGREEGVESVRDEDVPNPT